MNKVKYCTNCGNELKENSNFCTNCGKPTKKELEKIKKIEKDTDRDFYMDTNEAKEYGLIDNILEKNIQL